jgi:hypothetical protein
MLVHIHDHEQVHPCIAEFELREGRVITVHLHEGDCKPCPDGYCHRGSVVLDLVDGDLFVTFESTDRPHKVTCENQAYTTKLKLEMVPVED